MIAVSTWLANPLGHVGSIDDFPVVDNSR